MKQSNEKTREILRKALKHTMRVQWAIDSPLVAAASAEYVEALNDELDKLNGKIKS